MGRSESQGYITPYKMAPLDTKYPDQYDLRLVESQSDLKDMVDQIKQSKRIAIDTETTHVDWGYGYIVGISVAANDETGWYVPFLHENYEKNLPLSILPKLFPLFLNKTVLMYNAPFDEIMLNKEGWDCFKLNIRDVMGEVYLMDTNVHLPSLKYAERLFLGIEAPTFEETLQGRDHFGFVTPEEARIYAGTDAWGTRRLDTLLYPRLKQECPNAMKLDNAFVPILLKLNSNKMSIRTELLDQMLEYYKVEKKKLEEDIFKEMKYPFNLNSNKQLEIAFKQQGINTGYKTDKGNMSLKSEVLELIAHDYPFVKKIVKYKSMSSIESALKKFRGKDYIRCNYEMYNTVSGRMSSGSSKESAKSKLPKDVRSWFDPFNAQNFKKNKEILYRGIYSPNDPYAIMGYRFEHVEKDQIKPDDKIVEAMDYRGNTRRLVHAGIRDEQGKLIADESTHYFVKCDYSGAELRLSCPCATSVLPSSVGLIQAGQLNPRFMKLISEDNELLPFKVVKEDSEDMCEIEWSNGVIERYDNTHKVWAFNPRTLSKELVKVSELTPEHQVLSYLCTPDWEPSKNSIEIVYKQNTVSTDRKINMLMDNPIIPYFFGLYLGDGYTAKDYHHVSVVVWNEYLDFIKNELEALGLHIYIKNNNNSSKIKSIEITNKDFAHFTEEMFGRTGEDKHINPEIYRYWNKDLLKYFLAGLIDSDGSKKGKFTCFNNANRQLISDIAILCNCLGIISRNYHKGISGMSKKPMYRLVLSEIADKDIPIRKEHRTSKEIKNNIHWNVDGKLLKSKYSGIGVGNDLLRKRLNNIAASKGQLTRSTIDMLKKAYPDFDLISNDFYPIHMISRTPYKGTKCIIEVDSPTHLYKTGTTISHNCLFSKEPVLMKAFLDGIDPHTNTAQMMFGVGDKAHRAKAKTCLGERTLVRTNNGLKYPYELKQGIDKLEDENGNFVDWIMEVEDSDDMITVYYNNGLSEQYDSNHKVMTYSNGKLKLKAIKNIFTEGILKPDYIGNLEDLKDISDKDCNFILNKKYYSGKKYIIQVLTKKHLYKTQNSLSLNCNFSLLYLGTPDSLCRNSGLEIKEATDLWNQYWKTMRGLKSWQVKEIQKANVTGRCATAFGRPRRLGWYFRNPDPKMRSFAKRSTISHEVQGSLGDIIKMTLIKLYKNILENPVWQERKIAFDLVVHDEADCIVPKKHIQEYLDTFLELGKVQLPNWEFPLELSPEVGSSYGFVLPVFKDTDGIWKIEFKEGSKFIS